MCLQCLVSTGEDRMICVLDSPPGESNLEVVHFIEKAHKSSITCCTCSPPPSSTELHTTRFVATADDAGGVQVYDLRRITLLFRCASVHTREIRALHFPPATPGLLVSADVTGGIFVWPTIGVRSSIAYPLMRLVMVESTPSRPLQSKLELDGVTSICSTSVSPEPSHAATSTHPEMLYVGIETGQIFAWDLRFLTGNPQSETQPTRRSAILRRRSSNAQYNHVDIQAIEGELPVVGRR